MDREWSAIRHDDLLEKSVAAHVYWRFIAKSSLAFLGYSRLAVLGLMCPPSSATAKPSSAVSIAGEAKSVRIESLKFASQVDRGDAVDRSLWSTGGNLRGAGKVLKLDSIHLFIN